MSKQSQLNIFSKSFSPCFQPDVTDNFDRADVSFKLTDTLTLQQAEQCIMGILIWTQKTDKGNKGKKLVNI